MNDDIDVTPDGDSSPTFTLFRDSVVVESRKRAHNAERHQPVVGSPGSDTAGIGPAELTFRGNWVGTNASTHADNFESIIDDDTVEKVNLNARGGGSTRYDGTYRIAGNPDSPQPAPQSDGRLFSYTISLIKI